MLVLSRKLNEKIVVGDSIVLTVVSVQGSTVRLGIEAPRDVNVVREELLKTVAAARPAVGVAKCRSATASPSTAATSGAAPRSRPRR